MGVGTERGSEGRWRLGGGRGANILNKPPTQNAEFKNQRTVPHTPLNDSDKNTRTRAREIRGSNTFFVRILHKIEYGLSTHCTVHTCQGKESCPKRTGAMPKRSQELKCRGN